MKSRAVLSEGMNNHEVANITDIQMAANLNFATDHPQNVPGKFKSSQP